MWLIPQLGRGTGPPLLQLFLDLLRHLVLHCKQLDTQNRQKYAAVQAESDLFLDMESVALLELADDKVPCVSCPLAFPGKSVTCGPSLPIKANVCPLQGNRDVQGM